LRRHFKLPELEQKLTEAKLQRDFEKDRNDRPGEGRLWLPLEEKVRNAEGQLQLEIRRFKDASAPLDAAQTVMIRRREPRNTEEARQASREILAETRQLIARMEAYGYQSETSLDKIEDEIGSGSIEYSLRSLFTEIGQFMEGDLDRLSTYRFILSLFLSVVLDTALFIVIAVRRPQIQVFEEHGKKTGAGTTENKRIWDEKLW
jgi:hypothetical protein